VQRPPVEPGDQQRALLAQRPIDVGCRQALGTSANRQTRAPRILALDREQALGDAGRVALGRTGQPLGSEPLGKASASARPDDRAPPRCRLYSLAISSIT
jgi:hypothetical protein